MYDYGYGNYGLDSAYDAGKAASNFAGAGIWLIIAAILAVIGGIVVYYVFVKPKKSYDNKFLAWLKSFLGFKKMIIEGILKVFYLIGTLFCTLGSFAFFALGGLGVLMWLLTITLGNVLIRVLYESALLKIMIWRNTQDINAKLK